MMKERTTCRLCGHDKLPVVLSLPATPLANAFMKTREESQTLAKFPLSVHACARCGHHQLGVVVDPTVMFSNYSYASGTAASFRQHFNEYASAIIKRYMPVLPPHQLTSEPPKEPSRPNFRVLEVGSNDGTMMKALLNAGATSVIGCEPAQNLAKQCNAEGLVTFPEFFTDRVAHYGPVHNADFFTANNVLAHVDDFVGTLRALSLTNARAGVFEVQYLGALLDGGMFDMVYHEHLDYWRATELCEVLQTVTPWVVVDVEKVPTHGGSLRVWVERHSAPLAKMSDSMLDLLKHERFDWKLKWSLLKSRMVDEGKRIRNALAGKKRIAIFGAPAKLTTLLYGLGLTDIDFKFVADDSKLKQGLFTPGMGLEIRHPGQLDTHMPDAVLVGAWNFAAHIKPRLKELCPNATVVVPFE